MDLLAVLASMGTAGLGLFAVTGEWARECERKLVKPLEFFKGRTAKFFEEWPGAAVLAGPVGIAANGFWAEILQFRDIKSDESRGYIATRLWKPRRIRLGFSWPDWESIAKHGGEVPVAFPLMAPWRAFRKRYNPSGPSIDRRMIWEPRMTEAEAIHLFLEEGAYAGSELFGSAFQLRWARRLRGASIAMMFFGGVGALSVAITRGVS